MPRKAKTEETVVTEENAILENAPAETGTLMEGDSPAEGEILMDGGMPADGDSTMNGELPDSQEAAMNEEIPGSGETATEDGIPASDSAITDGDVPEETSLSGENMEAEAETGNDSGMALLQEDTGEPPSKVMERRLMQTILLRNFPLGPERKPKAAQGKITLKFQPLPEGGKQKPPLLQNRNLLYGRPPLPPSLP